jgi:signal transduction histidine kinase
MLPIPRLLLMLTLLLLGREICLAQEAPDESGPLKAVQALLRQRGVPDTMRVRLGWTACRLLTKIDLDSARHYGQQAVALARRIGFRAGEAQAANNLAAAIFYAGDYPAAQHAFEATLRAAQRADRLALVGNAYLGLGNVAHGVGNEPGALAYYEQARAAYAACRPPYVRGQLLVLQNIANNYLAQGNTDRAAPVVRQALALLEAGTEPRLKIAVFNLLGQVQADQHQPDSAVATWKRALQLAQATNNPSAEALAAAHLAESSLARNQPAQALTYAQQSLRLNRELGGVYELADAMHVLAVVMHQLKRPEAFDTLNRYLTLRDTLLSQERTDAVAEAQARFDQVEQQARIRDLEQQRRIDRLEAEQRRTRTRLWLLALAVGVGLLAIIFLRIYRRRQHHRDVILRQQIAADLHDDVGSLLTQISLQSELLSQGVYGPEQQGQYLAHMAEASRTAVRQMSDVVWGLHETSENNTLGPLLDRLREHAHDVLSAVGLEIDFATEPGLEMLTMSLQARQSLYLIYKEALHNAVKHAKGATIVLIRLSHTGSTLHLEVRDNGPAAAPANGNGRSGNGLRNMQARAAALSGKVAYTATESGFGVKVELPLD